MKKIKNNFRLNNKGFAITSIIYAMLLLFVVLMLLTVATLGRKKNILDKNREDTKTFLNNQDIISDDPPVDDPDNPDDPPVDDPDNPPVDDPDNPDIGVIKDDKDFVYFIQNGSGGVGDSTIIQSNGKYAMIDTHDNENNRCTYLSNFIKQKGIEQFEFVIITHFHRDHMGCLTQLIGDSNIKIKQIFYKAVSDSDSDTDLRVSDYVDANGLFENLKNAINNYNTANPNNKIKFTSLTVDTPKKLEDFGINIYNTEQRTKMHKSNKVVNQAIADVDKKKSPDTNAESAVILLKIHEKKILVSGDIKELLPLKYCHQRPKGDDKNPPIDKYTAQIYTYIDEDTKKNYNLTRWCYWENIANSINNNFGFIDIYKASHHGLYGNNKDYVLKKLLPPKTEKSKGSYTIITNHQESSDSVNALVTAIGDLNLDTSILKTLYGTIQFEIKADGTIVESTLKS